jgi:transcriptional regulator with XRE-family HTH domain
MSELIIKQLAKGKGVSMDEVARAAGYRQRTSLYQKMARNGLTTKQLDGIANVLGVSVPELFANALTCPHCGKQITIKIEKI